jgi:hypothetical protein
MKIANVFELLTDEEDKIRNGFTLRVMYEDGSVGELDFSLAGGQELKAILDAAPELDGEKW